MGVLAQQVRGDERTAELAAKNEKEVQFVPDEIRQWAEENPVHIFNVSPYSHTIQHPAVGFLTIPACKEGKRYSEPAVLKGMIPYGVCTDMKTVEIRQESGKFMACDLLGIGPFKQASNSLFQLGVFIASNDTFDAKDIVSTKVANGRDGKPIFLSLPRWVSRGQNAEKPSEKELAQANELFLQHDFRLIAEADGFWNEGPDGQKNIVKNHREALNRRGQLREWAKPLQSLIDCPGCGDKVSPSVVVHKCGAVFNWDKAIELGIKRAEDRPEPNKSNAKRN